MELSELSVDVQSAIQKAISKEFEEIKVNQETEVSFRGKVEIELDVVVKRGKDTTKVANFPPEAYFVPILSVLAIKAKVQPSEMEEFLGKCLSEAKGQHEEDVARYEDTILKLFNEVYKDEYQTKTEKIPNTARTTVKGVVRIGKITPKGRK